MEWWISRYWYVPIIIVIGAGYIFGCYWWYGITFLDLLPSINNPEARQYLQLFTLGILGGSMHCSILLAKDYNAKIHGKDKLPTCMEFLGYLLQIIGGGITGVILFLAFKAGLVVMIAGGGGTVEINNYAAWLISFAGGFGTHHVKRFINRFVEGSTKNSDKEQEQKSKADTQQVIPTDSSDAKQD